MCASKLLTETDDEISNPCEIMIHIKDFYSSFYQEGSFRTEAECLEYLRRINIPGLSQVESESCDAFLLKGNAGKP